ncbi:hypothetical protein L6278_02330 [Candidatus Parcubacteria bacterium]|nr:hypothetical protein [Candidatus Parcubacteria bacterium]
MRCLKKSLNKNKIKLSDSALFKLTFVDDYESLVIKENIDLLEIALKFYNKQNSREISMYIRNHTEKFSFFELHASTKSLLTENDFQKRLKKIFQLPQRELMNQLREAQNSNRKLKQEKQKIQNKYKFNRFEKQIINIFELNSEIKVKITDWVCLLNYHIVTNAKFVSKKRIFLKLKKVIFWFLLIRLRILFPSFIKYQQLLLTKAVSFVTPLLLPEK